MSRATVDRLARMPHVLWSYHDSDGYWIRYRDGYKSPRTGCGEDHEETASEALRAAREARTTRER